MRTPLSKARKVKDIPTHPPYSLSKGYISFVPNQKKTLYM